MEWQDEGIIVGLRRHGEANVILEVMTCGHGRHFGLVRGGRGRSLQPVLQPGNSVAAVWRARLDHHLGTFVVEATRLRTAAILASAAALHGVGLIGFLARLLPERDPHPALYRAIEIVADHLHDAAMAPALMIRLELAVLQELGFGLDLRQCAASGVKDDLVYVSPKSGRAVSRTAGQPYRARLLALPPFLRQASLTGPPDRADLRAGFALTGFFLERDVLLPRGLSEPDSRRAFLALLDGLG
jgi:DNA repair protein RecO (recombination protein O)